MTTFPALEISETRDGMTGDPLADDPSPGGAGEVGVA